MLREQGYTVLEAGSGEECLRVVHENGEKKIHLLLTDVVMPGLGGRELAEKLKDTHPDVKTIFFSGYPGEALARDGMLDQGIVFLPKPFSMPVLVRTVREVLDG
jgi:CheY-like chemotaxis protein